MRSECPQSPLVTVRANGSQWLARQGWPQSDRDPGLCHLKGRTAPEKTGRRGGSPIPTHLRGARPALSTNVQPTQSTESVLTTATGSVCDPGQVPTNGGPVPSHKLWGLNKMPCKGLCFQLLGMPGVRGIPNSSWEGAFEAQSGVPRRAHRSESRPQLGVTDDPNRQPWGKKEHGFGDSRSGFKFRSAMHWL